MYVNSGTLNKKEEEKIKNIKNMDFQTNSELVSTEPLRNA